MKIFIKIVLATSALMGLLNTLQAEAPSHGKMEVLSWSPRIFYFHNFLSETECDHFIAKARPELKRSTVVDDHASNQDKVHEARTSKGMFFPAETKDLIIKNVEKRIAQVTFIPVENGESIQVLAYEKGAEYQPHYDYFDDSSVGGVACLNRGGQRIASFIMYLNTPKAGGETIFPQAKVKVTPKKGDAVLFFDCLPNGNTDPLTLHGGAPVIEGEKWIATKWLRTGVFK